MVALIRNRCFAKVRRSRFQNSLRRRTTLAALIWLCVTGLICLPLSYHLTHASSQQPEGSTIAGTVQDETGQPVADVKVTLILQEKSWSSLSQADGKFEFKKVTPGVYRLVAESSGFRKDVGSVTVTRLGETVTPVIRLRPSSLHVSVFDAASHSSRGGVSVTLSTGEPERSGPSAPANPAARAVTDEGGDAYFGRLSPGSYHLTATLRGYEDYHSVVFISAGRITTDFTLPLSIAPVIPINDKATERFTVPSLPSKNVETVFQDSEGWIWFGTDKGITRFNGSEFKSSAAAGSSLSQLAGVEVRSIAEDRRGTIWLATPKGLIRIDKDGGSQSELLSGSDVRHVMAASDGTIWASTSAGQFRLQDGQVMLRLDVAAGLPSDDVLEAVEGPNAELFIVTGRGLATYRDGHTSAMDLTPIGVSALPENGLESPVHVTAPSRRRAPAAVTAGNPARDDKGPRRLIRCGFLDANNRIWVATESGVYFAEARESGGAGLAWKEAGALKARSIAQDTSGAIWFGLDGGGATLYRPEEAETQRIGSLDRDRVSGILSDREGNIWFGTDNGAVRTDPYGFVNFNTSRGLADNDVRGIVEYDGSRGTGSDPDPRRLYFATAAGVSVMNGEQLGSFDGFRARIPVRGVAVDDTNAIWFATDQGAFRLGGQTLTQLNEENGLVSNNVNWITNAHKNAATVLATAKGAAIYRDGTLSNIDALSSYDVRHVFEGLDGWLWFSTNHGVVGFEPGTGAVNSIDTNRGLADNDVRWIAMQNGNLLIATAKGVQAYGPAEGLLGGPSSNANGPAGGNAFSALMVDSEAASTVFVDRDGFVWIGADDGEVKKSRLFERQIITTVYSGESTSLTGKHINSFYQDREGRIWVATNSGAVRHIPLKASPISTIRVEVDGSTRQVDAPEGQTAVYDLPHSAHKLNFVLSGVSMAGQVRYLYRLKSERGNEPWTLLPLQQAAERLVSIIDIPEGSYRFELRALNRDLYGVSDDTAAVTIRIGPPVWKRWWFDSLMLALAALAALSFWRVRVVRAREYVLPRELRNYVRIEPNPYIVGNPIRTENMFYGREDDFRYVQTKLEGVSQGVVIVFCGERRVGKSSILYQVLNGRLGDRFVPVFIDMQEMVITTDSEFFERISRAVLDAIKRSNHLQHPISEPVLAGSWSSPAGVQVAPASAIRVPAFDGRNPYPIFIDFLDEVLRLLGDRTLLILLDEYELIEAKVDEGKLSRELFTFLAGVMDNKERLSLIFTGSRRLEERDRKYWRELLRRSLFRKVAFLSENDARRLIEEPVQGRIVYGRSVPERIFRLTAGQPFYIQVVCQNVVDYLNEHRQNWVVTEDLNKVIDEILDNPLPQMIYTWDGLSDDEKVVLSLLAEGLSGDVEYAPAASLRVAVASNNYPVHLSEYTIRLTLEEMFRRDILDKAGAGEFRFRMDLFRVWIRKSHSIWQVVNEVRTL